MESRCTRSGVTYGERREDEDGLTVGVEEQIQHHKKNQRFV